MVYRTLRFGFFGASVGPVVGRWNQFLETRFPLIPTGTTATSIPLQSAKNDFSPAELFPEGALPKGARFERGSTVPGRGENVKPAGAAKPSSGSKAHQKDPASSKMQLFKRVAADQLFM